MHRYAFLVVALILILAGVGWSVSRMHRATPPPPPLPTFGEVPDFALIDQDGKPVRRADLAGHPYILDFIFTSCTDFCPVMTQEMGRIRKILGPQTTIRSVSISVDPEHDNPQALKKFADSHQAADRQWYFLTGERKGIMQVLLGLHLASQRDVEQPNPRLHNTRLILVDAQGAVRGYYQHDDDEARQRLVQDARSLESPAAAAR